MALHKDLQEMVERRKAQKSIESYMKAVEKALPHTTNNRLVSKYLTDEYDELLKWDKKLEKKRIGKEDKEKLRAYLAHIREALRQGYSTAEWLTHFSELAEAKARTSSVAVGDETTGELKKKVRAFIVEQRKKLEEKEERKKRIRKERPHIHIVK